MFRGSESMKKFLLIFICMLLSSCAYSLELPEKINDWHSVNEFITPLIASEKSQDLGRVIYKDYERENPKKNLQIILTEGKGTGNLYVPEKVKTSKGLMPSEAGYKILNVAGKSAILETQSYLPLVLAVKVDNNIVLTIESKSLNENEIVKFAEELLLSKWSNTK